jgi:hypothetical protein
MKALGLILGILSLGACTQPTSLNYQSTKRAYVHEVYFETVRFRTRVSPLEDTSGYCRTPEEFWRPSQIPMRRLLECLKDTTKLKTAVSMTYRLERKPMDSTDFESLELPYLKLVPSDSEAPRPRELRCLEEIFPELDLPTEVFMVPVEEGAPGCNIAQVALEQSQFLGFRLPWKVRDLTLSFPLSKTPQTESEVMEWLVTWVIGVYRDPLQGLSTRVVPRRMCEVCMGPEAWEKFFQAPSPRKWVF